MVYTGSLLDSENTEADVYAVRSQRLGDDDNVRVSIQVRVGCQVKTCKYND